MLNTPSYKMQVVWDIDMVSNKLWQAIYKKIGYFK